MNDLKDRWDKLDDRAKMLIEKYPLVGAAFFTAGILVGLAIAWVF